MFYYYGGKARLAGKYPAPRHPLIIEPFAGAAGYSMHHLRRGNAERAILVEKDPRVVALWRRLLALSPAEVLAIPIPEVGTVTDDFLYMTTATSNGVAGSRRMTVTSRMPELVGMMARRIADLLPYVAGRVEVIEGDYRAAPLVDATWFVDPPYQPHVDKVTSTKTANPQGMGYAPGCTAALLDFDELGRWCGALPGQVIAVEQAGADWLPFQALASSADSQGRRKAEVIWTSDAEVTRHVLFA
jgi:16S rRNA G966 N2-methylase RsmD